MERCKICVTACHFNAPAQGECVWVAQGPQMYARIFMPYSKGEAKYSYRMSEIINCFKINSVSNKQDGITRDS
jgi:hypothetical protein